MSEQSQPTTEIVDVKPATSYLPMILAIVGGLVVGAAFLFGPKALESLRAPSVVIVDAVRIVEAASKVAREYDKPEDAMKFGKEIAEKLNAELQLYSAKGVVVLVKQAVMSAPAAADVTQDVAKRIGVEINEIPGR